MDTFNSFYMESVQAGFPSPAQDYEEKLNVQAFLVPNPEATFFMRVQGDFPNLPGGVYPGDLLIVDRSLSPRNGNVIVARYLGVLYVCRLKIVGRREGQRVGLFADFPDALLAWVDCPDELEVLGVVRTSIHSLV
ncbi:MAG TPA: S24 family peptidase [Thermotogota bacterium]|nr:S24 family peptidase [Thermotogota bacterium]HRW93879.1 S24 family peptidase [Thermotogota bacterium]